tara:strand:+ start:1312 stop:2502 length:1191 start_codon:yes stop_codon:yes gene_type:complete
MLLPLFFRFFGLISSFLLNIYLSQHVDKEQLGLYFWLTQIMIVLSVFLRCGLDVAILKYGALVSHEFRQKALVFYTSRVLLPFLFTSILVIWVSSYILDAQIVKNLAFVLLSTLPFSIFNLISEYFKSSNYQSLATIIQSCLLPILTFIGMTYIYGHVIFAYAFSVTTLCAISIVFMLTFPHKNVSDIKINSDTEFGLRAFFFISILNIIMNSMDMLMLGIFESHETVAEYGIANKLVLISSVLLISINGILGPKFSLLWHEKKVSRLKLEFIKSAKGMAIISIAVFFLFFVFGNFILEFLYGENYKNSYDLLVILAFGQSIVLATGPVAYLLMMTNYKHVHQRSMIISVGVNFVFNLFLIPAFGAIGAAVATSLGLIIKNVYSFWALLKIYHREI